MNNTLFSVGGINFDTVHVMLAVALGVYFVAKQGV